MLYEYLIQHNLKYSPYVIRLYSLICYIECMRMAYGSKTIKNFLTELTYDKVSEIMIGCVAGLSQGSMSLAERLNTSDNIKVNYQTIEHNSIKIFDHLFKYNERNPDGKILDNYFIQGINGNLDKIINE